MSCAAEFAFTLVQLPGELLERVLACLGEVRDVRACRQVCKLLKQLATNRIRKVLVSGLLDVVHILEVYKLATALRIAVPDHRVHELCKQLRIAISKREVDPGVLPGNRHR